jgi:putative NADPH-quinone reductase
MKRLLVVNGHPDPRPERFCSALCCAYTRGAESAGWQTRHAEIGELSLSSLQSLEQGNRPDADVLEIFDQLSWADRLAVVYPLWFDQPPQGVRALFAYRAADVIGERRAQLVVTMDMPAFAWRSMLRPGTAGTPPALSLPGLLPDDPVLIGSVSSLNDPQRHAWLDNIHDCGQGWAGASILPGWTLAAAIDRTMSHFGLG